MSVKVYSRLGELLRDRNLTMAWWTEVQSDPARYEAIVQESLDQQQARAAV